jgi:hypothetical protein
VARPLARLAREAKDPRTRLHAVFVLDGLGQAKPAVAAAAAHDKDAFVAAAGKALLEQDQVAMLGKVAGQLAARPTLEGARLPEAKGRELALLGRLLMEPAFAAEAPGRAALVKGLAARVVSGGDPEKIGALLGMAVGEPKEAAWRQLALLEAVAAAHRPGAARIPRPEGWGRLARSQDPAIVKHAEALEGLLAGEPERRPRGERARPLGGEELARFARGKALYPGICGALPPALGPGRGGQGPAPGRLELGAGAAGADRAHRPARPARPGEGGQPNLPDGDAGHGGARGRAAGRAHHLRAQRARLGPRRPAHRSGPGGARPQGHRQPRAALDHRGAAEDQVSDGRRQR